MNLTHYEQRALKEIEEWETAKPGLVIKTMDALGRPVTVIMEKVPRPFEGPLKGPSWASWKCSRIFRTGPIPKKA